MKKSAMALMAVFLTLCLAGCGNPPEEPPTPRPSDLQEACEQVVSDFTDGEPIEFDRIIASDEEDNAWRQAYYSGNYVFTDDRYEYTVDPERLYIKRISTVSNEVRSELHTGDTQAGTEEDAETLAVEIYRKALSEFLLEDGGTEIKCLHPGEGIYFVEINETINGIQTGTFAGIDLSTSGNILGASFILGDPGNIDRLINEQNKMISEENAKQIALEEVNRRAEKLEAESIQIDDSKPCEIITLGDTTVWVVPFTYIRKGQPANQPFDYGGQVMVEVFSGEVFNFSLYA